MKKFKVGDICEVIALYGGYENIKVLSRTEDTVTVKHGEHYILQQIRWNGSVETLPIIVDKEWNCEKVQAWEREGAVSYYSAEHEEEEPEEEILDRKTINHLGNLCGRLLTSVLNYENLENTATNQDLIYLCRKELIKNNFILCQTLNKISGEKVKSHAKYYHFYATTDPKYKSHRIKFADGQGMVQEEDREEMLNNIIIRAAGRKCTKTIFEMYL